MFKKILEGIIPTLLIGVGWFSWEVDSESEVYVQEVYSSLFKCVLQIAFMEKGRNQDWAEGGELWFSHNKRLP